MNEQNMISIRFSNEQYQILQTLASQEKLSLTVYCRKILTGEIEKVINKDTIIQNEIHNLKNMINELTLRENFTSQLFHTFLINWFVSHPKVDNLSEKIAIDASNRLNEFDRYIINELFETDKSLYDELFDKYSGDEE